MPTFASGEHCYVNLTLDSLNAASGGLLANDLTYIAADTIVTSTHQVPATTNYVGETLELVLDTNTLQTTLEPGSATTLTNKLTVLANTKAGYTLTASMASGTDTNEDTNTDTNTNSLIGQSTGQTIPAITTKPTAGQLGWAVSLDSGSTWQAMPRAGTSPITIRSYTTGGLDDYTTNLTYGISTTTSTIADTYTGQVIYTVVGSV